MKKSAASSASPPSSLSAEGKARWREIVRDFAIEDSAGLLLLRSALESLDRMREAQRQLKLDGLTVKDRWAQLKPHPCTAIERDAKASMLACFRALKLDIEPLNDGPGRPSGS